MTKFLNLCAVIFVFLVSTVAALPQEHLAPASQPKSSSKVMAGRVVLRASIQDQVSQSDHGLASVHERQVHNADYGSDSGPTGNPQKTTEAAQSPTPVADNSESASGAADDSSNDKKRRDFDPRPTDINYIEEDDS